MIGVSVETWRDYKELFQTRWNFSNPARFWILKQKSRIFKLKLTISMIRADRSGSFIDSKDVPISPDIPTVMVERKVQPPIDLVKL